MPKSQKDKSEISLPDDKNQLLLSKYFFPSTNRAHFRKRFSVAVTDTSPLKVPKFGCMSSENSELEGETSLPQKTDSDKEIETCKLNETPGVPGSSKNILSRLKFIKQCKSEKRRGMLTFEQEQQKKNEFTAENVSFEKMSLDVPSVEKKIKYTPLEKQYLEFEAKYLDAVLFIECGYKYRLFGKDAEIARKDLNIGCYQYHNFLSASIPVYRLHYHVKRLVLKGYKVGVIKQTESAALKAAGETKNELFSRELHAMYTNSTFLEEELSTLHDGNSIEVESTDGSETDSGYLICINERQILKSINIACVAVQISSGDIFYSSFEDSLVQNELENYLSHINLLEILLPASQLSKKTEILVKSFGCDKSSRIERLGDESFEQSFALNNMSRFFTSQDESPENLEILVSLPPLVISCLSALRTYLADFKLEKVLKNIKNIQPFSSVDYMVLNAATLRSLEILRNTSNPPYYGTLFWCMNRTMTKFGERLLKSWIVKPLKDVQKIEERLNIIAEIIHSDSIVIRLIPRLFSKLPDVERLLCSVFYHKCSCYDFYKLVKALTNIKNELFGITDLISRDIEEQKLKAILLNILKYLDGIERYCSNIDPDAAKDGNKLKIFLDTSKFESIEQCKSEICKIEKMLSDLRPSICKVLRVPAFKYSTVAGQKFLIEVPNSHLSLVPDEWLKISATKKMSRFCSPEIIQLCKDLDQEQERLIKFANEAWEEFLNEFGKEFYNYKRAISYLSELDVFMALAKISKDGQYCRPLISVDNRRFEFQQGRHPVVVKLMGEENQFVANDLNLNDTTRCVIVTGPNMGGKSTYIRQTALIALMAHIGCFVPADSATIPLLDGIYVRMGADDDIVNKNSTFMSEMSEASSILSSATSNSLVIFDELGRGTSTNDGASIAFATLEYLIKQVRCITLFVTHYPTVLELKNYYPENILTVHLAYILKELDDEEDIQTVTFLYSVVSGFSEQSYGINVAALAGISKDILLEAQKKSREMELKMTVQRQLTSLLQSIESQNSGKITIDCAC